MGSVITNQQFVSWFSTMIFDYANFYYCRWCLCNFVCFFCDCVCLKEEGDEGFFSFHKYIYAHMDMRADLHKN